MVVLGLAERRVQGGGSFSVEVFKNEFCAPMKALEQWKATRQREFGSLATSVPSFESLINALKSEARCSERKRLYPSRRYGPVMPQPSPALNNLLLPKLLMI